MLTIAVDVSKITLGPPGTTTSVAVRYVLGGGPVGVGGGGAHKGLGIPCGCKFWPTVQPLNFTKIVAQSHPGTVVGSNSEAPGVPAYIQVTWFWNGVPRLYSVPDPSITEQKFRDRAWLMAMMFALTSGTPGMLLHLLQLQALEAWIAV